MKQLNNFIKRDQHSHSSENWEGVFKDVEHRKDAINKRGKAICKDCGKPMNLPKGYADYCYDCRDKHE